MVVICSPFIFYVLAVSSVDRKDLMRIAMGTLIIEPVSLKECRVLFSVLTHTYCELYNEGFNPTSATETKRRIKK
jgi:hypothetical protein